MKRLVYVLSLVASLAVAAPAPKPALPTAVAFTQGLVTRTLPIPNANCVRYAERPVDGQHGLRRFQVLCGNIAQGSFVQFQADAGPIYAAWLWPEQACGPKPAPVIQFFECPFGTH